MKLSKTLLAACLSAAMVFVMGCVHDPHDSTSTDPAENQNQNQEAEKESSGGTLKETLWFFEKMESHSDRPVEPSENNSGTETPIENGETSSGENTKPVADNKKIYIHFINDIDCVYGNVEINGDTRVWTPMYSETYSVNNTTVSFNFIYKALKDTTIDEKLYAWINTGWTYNSESPSDHGLKHNGISFTADSKLILKNSYDDQGYPAYTKYTWSKQDYTDAEIDGLLISDKTTEELNAQTFVNKDGSFITLNGRFYTGSLYVNKDGSYAFKSYNKNMKRNYDKYPAVDEECDSDNFWVFCGNKVIVCTKSLTVGEGTLYKAYSYDAQAASLDEYKKVETIYAKESEKKCSFENAKTHLSYDVDLLPGSVAYPSIVSEDVDSKDGWLKDKAWCYQNATFYGEYDANATIPNPEVKLVFGKEGSYTLYTTTSVGTTETHQIDSNKILPDRFFISGTEWTVEVTDNEKGTIKLTENKDDGQTYTVTFYERPTLSDEIKAGTDLKIKDLYLLASENDCVDVDYYADINEASSTVTIYLKETEDFERNLKNVKMHYHLNSKDALIMVGENYENSYSAYDFTGAQTITVKQDDFTRTYTLVVDKSVCKVTFDANNAEYEAEIEDIYISPKLGYISLPELEVESWKFKGWNTKQDGTGDSLSDSIPADKFSRDFTLYGQWECEKESAEVTVNCNWYTVSTTFSGYLEYESTTLKISKKPGTLLTKDDILNAMENKEIVSKGFELVTDTESNELVKKLFANQELLKKNDIKLPEPAAFPVVKANGTTVYDVIFVPKKVSFKIALEEGYSVSWGPETVTLVGIFSSSSSFKDFTKGESIKVFDVEKTEGPNDLDGYTSWDFSVYTTYSAEGKKLQPVGYDIKNKSVLPIGKYSSGDAQGYFKNWVWSPEATKLFEASTWKLFYSYECDNLNFVVTKPQN